MKLALTYEFNCTAAEYWAVYFDPAFPVRLHLDALGSTSASVIEQIGDLSSGISRTLVYAQRPDAPGPIKNLFGAEITSTEVSEFDPATSTATFTLTPGTLAEKISIAGVIQMIDAPDGGQRSTQAFSLEAKVKIFGVGPVAERFIERQARDVQEKAIAYLRHELGA